MQKLVLLAIGAIIIASALFGLLLGYRYTSDLVILWPEGVGASALPAALALFWAGARKLFSREAVFLRAWLVAFVVFSALFATSTYISTKYYIDQSF